jgi:transposase-like protein
MPTVSLLCVLLNGVNMANETKTVHMKCRRGNDMATRGQSCNGMSVERLSSDGDPSARFRCATCNFTWSIIVGGSFNT